MAVKRKMLDREIEDEGDGCQRESILSLSMDKLRSKTMRRVEPPLLRSVLILNTLKYIESDLYSRGIQYAPIADPSIIIPEMNVDQIACDSLPQTLIGQSTNEYDSSAVQAAPVMSKIDNHFSPLPPIESFVSSPGIKDSLNVGVFEWLSQTEKTQLDCFFSSDIPLRVEDIFNDIDQTFDIFTSIASSLKLTPLSAEESATLSRSMNIATSENLTPLLSSPLSLCKNDPMRDDLDHIVQILVGN